MSERRQFIVIDPKDNVATAIADLHAGDKLQEGTRTVVLAGEIHFGHKFALVDVPEGEYIIKYGAPIGRATATVRRGDHVHIHNVQDIVDEVRKG